jgi:hypothetical protein
MVKWDCKYIRISTPPSVCIERAELTYPELVPIIGYMFKNWEGIDPDEGPVIDCHIVPPLPHERGDLTP